MSASSRDARAHVRGDSIAYKRNTPATPEKKAPASLSSSRTKTSKAGDTTDALASLKASHQRTNLIRAFIGLVLLFVTYNLVFSPYSSSTNVAHAIKQRKARLAGVGESHVLPKRWREGHSAVGGSHETLSECKRILLFKFSGSHGFSSEINLYVRASVIASKLGYTLLADDVDWNYGSLQNYFMPKQIYCRPPADWFLPKTYTPLGSKRWASSDRVFFTRSLASRADAWLRSEILDGEAMQELKDRKLGSLLPEGETLPAALEETFVDFSAALRDLWKPNDELAVMIRRQRMELGLGEGGLRHRKNSPTWGGNRRKGSSNQRQAVEDVDDEDKHDYDEAGGAERSDRGPVIGAHLGFRDHSAVSRVQGIKSDVTGSIDSVEGINEALRRLSKSTLSEPGYSRGRVTLFPKTASPSIVLLTANRTSAATLRWEDDSGRDLKLQLTSTPPREELKRWNQVLRLELDDKLQPPTSQLDMSKAVEEYDQEVFNALPLSLRVYLARYFLRDLTTLALYADAFIVHASSNTGRLSCLLAGEDAVVGPREISGRGLGGRVRSVDGWWFPSSTIEGLWES